MLPSIQVQFIALHLNPIKQDVAYPQSSQGLTRTEDINQYINPDFEENSPFQEGVMSKTF